MSNKRYNLYNVNIAALYLIRHANAANLSRSQLRIAKVPKSRILSAAPSASLRGYAVDPKSPTPAKSNSVHLPRGFEPTEAWLPAPRVVVGLSLLTDAYQYARDTATLVDEFALDYGCLREAGLLPIDLHWLIRKGWVLHLREVAQPNSDGRRFQPTPVVTVGEQSWFVLTVEGSQLGCCGHAPLFPRPGTRPPCVPVWYSCRRELYWEAVLVKRFRVPAPNQELILAAFQEEGWPNHLHDPLPMAPGVEPKRRLHDTIVAMNRHQSSSVLRFSGDGTGEGLLWETVAKG